MSERSQEPQEQIFDEMRRKVVGRSHFFGRELLTVRYEDFHPYRDHFMASTNWLNDKENFRTTESFKHIHAVRNGKLVQFHYDYGNVSRNILFGLVHFFTDMIPYFLWHLITLRRPYRIEEN